MKNMVLLTKEEYDYLVGRINYWKHANDETNFKLNDAIHQTWIEAERANNLWNQLNRPAIEALQAKHDAEYYAWCEKVAEKYEELDYQEWCTNKARFYNNGVYDFCEENGISEEEAYSHRQYYYCTKFWSTKAINSGLMDEMDDMEIDVIKTEGWSEIIDHHNHFATPAWLYWADHFDLYKGWDTPDSKTAYDDLKALVVDTESFFNNIKSFFE